MEKGLTEEAAARVFRAIPSLVDIPARRYSVDYDQEADVLYISFKRPQKATDTETNDDGMLLRYRGEDLVGITVLDVSARVEASREAA